MLCSTVKAQVLVTEDFEGGSSIADFPQWTTIIPPFELLDIDPCGGDYSLRNRANSGATSTYLQYIYQAPPAGSQTLVKVPMGDDIEISFDYKLVNFSGGSATTGNFGTIDLYYTADGGTTWSLFDTIDQNDLPTADCSNYTNTISGTNIPAGSDFGFRLETNWNQGDYYIYFDNFSAIEQVSCIAPLDLEVDESTITFDGADISWVDENGASEWTVYYCQAEGDPTIFNPTCSSVTVTGSPQTTLTGLNDGVDYYVYVVAECSSSDSSAASYAAQFQTIAIGTDCTVPIQINNDPNNPVAGDLPYSDNGDTDTFGNALTGQPGANCGASTTVLGDSYDVVYRYVPSTDDILTISLSNLDNVDNVSVLVYEDCADIGSFCVAGGSTETASDFSVGSIFVDQGEDYYIVITSGNVGGVANTSYDLDIEGFDCNTWVVPDGDAVQDFVAGQTLSEFSMTGIGINPTITGATLTWYEDNNGAQGPLVTGPLGGITLTDGDVYYVTQNIGTCESPALQVTFDEFDCLTDLGGILTSQGDSVCESGSMILNATANNPDNIYWYDSATGGEPIAVGENFTTPTISQTTSYWASEVFIGESEIDNQASPGPVTSSTSSSNYGLTFTASQPFTLVSVDVYSAGTGNVSLELVGPSGPVGGTIVRPLNSGSTASPALTTLSLNIDIPTTGTYTLRKINGPAMMYTPSANANFPYDISTVASITSGATTSSTTTSYYYFYNWTIVGPAVLCESAREEVEAVVYDIEPISISAVNDVVCVGGSADLTATSTDTDYQYTWSWVDASGNQTDTGANITPLVNGNTTFTVEGYNPITTCSTTETIEITANGVGDLGVIPISADICADDVISLTAGSEIYDFNDGAQGWTTQNSSTAVAANPASAAWQIVNSPYSPPGTPAVNLTSNDGSSFYVSVADQLGSGADLDTRLISPSVNLVGVSSFDLSYEYFFRNYDYLAGTRTEFTVEVSTDQGNTWQVVQTYDDTRTAPSGPFESATVSLDQFVGNTNVLISFHYTGDWGWWVALDNVVFERDFVEGFVTWSPLTDLYFDEEATIPYDGSPVNEVYFTQPNEGQYSYTALLNFNSCPDVSSIVDISVSFTDMPTTADQVQLYTPGDVVDDLEVSGTDLNYYIIDANGDYSPVTINYLLSDGVTYYVTQTENGCESDFLAITTQLECPQPTNLVLVDTQLSFNGNSASILIEWDEPSTVTSIQDYVIEITDDTSVVYTGTVESGNDFEVINGLPLDANLTLTMYSLCDPNIPVISGEEVITFTTTNLSVVSRSFDNLAYYPNPVVNNIHFRNDVIIDNIEIYNITGQKVLSKQIDNNETVLSLESFSSGVYFASVYVDGSKKIVKIIKE